MQRQRPLRPRTRSWIEGASARSSDPRPSPACTTWPPLEVDPQFPAPRYERSLRSLYCCSDAGPGAPATNLSRKASFYPNEWMAPSDLGIKHLGGRWPSLCSRLLTFRRSQKTVAVRRYHKRPVALRERRRVRSLLHNDGHLAPRCLIPRSDGAILSLG